MLDVLVLQAIDEGCLHGYAICQWVRDAMLDPAMGQEGAIYPALHRLATRGLVVAESARTARGRAARFYSLTGEGKAALADGSERWCLFATRVLAAFGDVAENVALSATR